MIGEIAIFYGVLSVLGLLWAKGKKHKITAKQWKKYDHGDVII